jgi:hypothetical protein
MSTAQYRADHGQVRAEPAGPVQVRTDHTVPYNGGGGGVSSPVSFPVNVQELEWLKNIESLFLPSFEFGYSTAQYSSVQCLTVRSRAVQSNTVQ